MSTGAAEGSRDPSAKGGDAGTSGVREPEGAVGVPGGAPITPPGPARLRAVLDSLDEVVFQTDAAGTWTYLNHAWAKVTGFPVADTLGRPFLEFVHPAERAATLELFEQVVGQGLSHCHHETRYLTADGSSVWVELRASVLRDEEGRICGNAGTILDISARRHLEAVLADQTRILELIAAGAPLEETLASLAGHLAQHVDGLVVVSAAADPWRGRLPGTAAGEVVGPRAVGSPDGNSRAWPASATDQVLRHLRWAGRREFPIEAAGQSVGTITLHHRDPDALLVDTIQQLVERCARFAAIAITRHRAEGEVRHQAFHDPLTGLPNRALITDRLEQALLAAQRRDSWLAVVLLDLDHFKHVNDRLGHDIGDRVLRTVARRLSEAVRASDTVSRLGGDEFVVVLTDLRSRADAERLAGELLRTLHEPLVLESVRMDVHASAGVAVSQGAEKSLGELFREADVAMYRAKQQGGGHVLFDSARDEARLNLIGLAADLQDAIRHGQLFLRYQPKVNLADGSPCGLEGLVRWQHPARGLVPPGDFIPVAEATGAINPLSLWVLRTALQECRRWEGGGAATTIAINLSAPMMHDPDLPELVARALGEAQLEAERLELEITESAVMANPEAARTVMRRIVSTGVTFAIDDFGTGYSSLSYLKRLPVRAIKIDRSFIRDMTSDERDTAIVHSVIDLAHSLGMEVVAEGVETDAVRERLGDLGCDSAQGYLFAHPLDVADVPGWLSRAGAAPP